MINTEDYLKITFFGDKFTGKTTAINRIVRNNVIEQYTMSLNVGITPHTVYIETAPDNKIPIDVLFSDMPGQYSLSHSYLSSNEPQVDALVLLFALNDMRSFEEVKKWMYRMLKKDYAPRPMVIVGNKLDLVKKNERRVAKAQVFEFIKRVEESWRFEKYPEIEIPIKYMELSVIESDRKVFDTMISYLAGESFKIIQQSQTGGWDYFY